MATHHPRLDDLLKLPLEERARLAHALLVSLDDGPPDADADAAWSDELARRLRALEDGTAELVDGAEVRRRVRDRLRSIRSPR